MSHKPTEAVSDTLLPCPFCGGEATLVQWTDYQVVCRNRHCFGPVTSPYGFSSDAITAWNTRAASEVSVGAVGTLDIIRDAVINTAKRPAGRRGPYVFDEAGLQELATVLTAAMEAE